MGPDSKAAWAETQKAVNPDSRFAASKGRAARIHAKEKNMSYENSTPRAAFGVIAAALTAMTIGLAVVLPSKTDATQRDMRLQAESRTVAPASEDIAGSPLRVDVIGVRESSLVSVRAVADRAKRKQQS
jgi:hypothetical protein